MVSFSAYALFCGFWFRRWTKIYVSNFGLVGEERIWPGLGMLGWFSGLMFVGSAAGAVAWGCDMQGDNPILFTMNPTPLTVTRQRGYLLAAS